MIDDLEKKFHNADGLVSKGLGFWDHASSGG